MLAKAKLIHQKLKDSEETVNREKMTESVKRIYVYHCAFQMVTHIVHNQSYRSLNFLFVIF